MKLVINAVTTTAMTALVAFSANSFAAKPTSIVFSENAQNAEGMPYANYMVKCSNGKKAELTAWDNRRKWCVGDMNSEDCQKKQIKAAKAACKAA